MLNFLIIYKIVFNYLSQRKPAGKRGGGTDWMVGSGRARQNPLGMKAVWKPLVKLRLQGWKKTGRN